MLPVLFLKAALAAPAVGFTAMSLQRSAISGSFFFRSRRASLAGFALGCYGE